jgi:3-methyladenine DNA glycosylase/8-oxoguanine DNA glycosylase
VIEATFTPRGPYRLRHMRPSGVWSAALPGGGDAFARQLPDGRVVVRAPNEQGLELARFMLALDDDTSEFHRRFARDPLLGASARAFVGYRTPRRATVAHAALRAVCGQLIEARRAIALERRIIRATGVRVPSQAVLARFAPVELRRLGLGMQRASALVRLCRTVELERLKTVSSAALERRLCRERGIGPWSIGLIALEGLGRYDRGLVGDLALVKLLSSLRGRWVEGWETAEMLAPYGEWQGLAGKMLLIGWAHGLVPGADGDVARLLQHRARRAA